MATDRVEVTLRDADPGESPKKIQKSLTGIKAFQRKRMYDYWNQFGDVFPAFTIRRR